MENYKSKLLFSVTVLLVFIFISCKESDNAGLIGVYYNRVDLTYPKAIMNVNDFCQKWDEDVDYKAGSGAIWNGYLEAPFSGEVTLKVTTTKKASLKINDIEIASEYGSSTHKMDMDKGKKYPVELTFLNLKDGVRTGEFQVLWSWENNDFSLIEKEFLSHTKKEIDELAWLAKLDVDNLNPKDFLKAKNAEHSIVYYEKGRFGGWPANNGIWMWGDEILVSFSRAFYKNKPHQHSTDANKPGGRTFARSMDGGKTWKLEDKTVVYPNDPLQLNELKEKINFKHPGFAFTSNGNKFSISYDKGKTWDATYIYPDYDVVDAVNHSARTDYVVLDENTCRIFMASEQIGEKGWAQDMAYMLETRDGGENLEFVSWIAETDTFRSVMPATVKITNDHMVSALRRRYNAPRGVNHALRKNWIDLYETKDGGRTWQFLNKIAETDRGRRNGNPPAMVQLSDGTLCIAYAYRGVPFSVRVRTSTDNGKTWSREIIIRDDAIKWDMGYVRMVARSDDKVVMVYYYNTEERPEQHIECTIWNPKETMEYN